MKPFFFITIFISFIGGSAHAQDDCDRAILGMPYYRVLYWEYDNRIEFSECQNCDTVLLKLKGVDFTPTKNNSGILNVEADTKRATVQLLCVKGKDTVNYGAFGFQCRELPNPKIFLGSTWLGDPLINDKDDNETIFQAYFSLRYTDQMVRGLRFKIKEWSITVGKRTYFGETRSVTKDFRDAIIDAGQGAKIQFNYCDVSFPNGKTRRIHINRLYYKKTEYGTKPEITKQSTIAPLDE